MDYAIYKLLTPVVIGFILLSISISSRYLKQKISQIILHYQISVLIYLIFNYLEFISSSPDLIVFFAKWQHFGLEVLAYFWFYFALNYTGYEWVLNNRARFILFLAIIINTVLIQTNQYHHQFYTSYSFLTKGDFTVLRAEYGPLFWIISAYSYMLLIAGMAFITIAYLRGKSFFRRQAFIVVVGFIFPLVANIIYIFRIFPHWEKDYSPIAFGLTGLFIFISIYRFKLLHFSPVARNLILQAFPNSIITLDYTLKIIDFNENARDYFNLTDYSLGLYANDTSVGEFIGSLQEKLDESDEFITTKSVNSTIFEIKIKKLLNERGKYKAIIINIVDITDKISLINRLEESYKQLKNIQSQLVEKEKMAALGQISAGVAHEINNPLSFIKSNIGLLETYVNDLYNLPDSDKKNKRYHNTLELIYDSKEGVERIGEVVKNLLGYARNDSSNSKFDLNKNIESTLVIARNKYKYKARIILDLGHIPELYSNGAKINQVLLNLITNSAQSIHDEKEDGFIKIKTFIEGDIIVGEISDNGNPINVDIIDKIFDQYFTTKGDKGNGIGLSLSRDIIEEYYNGKLYLKDAKNKVFRFELPVNFVS